MRTDIKGDGAGMLALSGSRVLVSTTPLCLPNHLCRVVRAWTAMVGRVIKQDEWLNSLCSFIHPSH